VRKELESLHDQVNIMRGEMGEYEAKAANLQGEADSFGLLLKRQSHEIFDFCFFS
jgi:hypothetical protein